MSDPQASQDTARGTLPAQSLKNTQEQSQLPSVVMPPAKLGSDNQKDKGEASHFEAAFPKTLAGAVLVEHVVRPKCPRIHLVCHMQNHYASLGSINETERLLGALSRQERSQVTEARKNTLQNIISCQEHIGNSVAQLAEKHGYDSVLLEGLARNHDNGDLIFCTGQKALEVLKHTEELKQQGDGLWQEGERTRQAVDELRDRRENARLRLRQRIICSRIGQLRSQAEHLETKAQETEFGAYLLLSIEQPLKKEVIAHLEPMEKMELYQSVINVMKQLGKVAGEAQQNSSGSESQNLDNKVDKLIKELTEGEKKRDEWTVDYTADLSKTGRNKFQVIVGAKHNLKSFVEKHNQVHPELQIMLTEVWTKETVDVKDQRDY